MPWPDANAQEPRQPCPSSNAQRLPPLLPFRPATLALTPGPLHLLFLLSGELCHQPIPSLDLCSNVTFLGHSVPNSTPRAPYPPHSTYFPTVIMSILSSFQEMTSEHQTPYLALPETKERFPTPGRGTMLGISSRGRQGDTGGVQACVPRRHPTVGSFPLPPQGPTPGPLPSTRWPTASDAHGGAPPTDSPPRPHQPSRMQPCRKLRFHPLGCGRLTSPGESGPSLLLPGLCCLPWPSG